MRQGIGAHGDFSRVQKAGSTTVTSAVRGLFRQNISTRQEAMRFVTGRG